MKFKITAQMDAKSANEVASKILAAMYQAEIDLDSLDVELVSVPSSDDIRILSEEGPSDEENHSGTFHFPRTRELMGYLGGGSIDG